MVSVALATYNGEKYILPQLESLFYQTYPIDEVVICDDRSQDDTAGKVNAFIVEKELQGKWRFIQNEKNLGYAENFKKAMTMCSGDYIFCCDQDDIWDENKVKDMSEVLSENEDIQLLGSEFTSIFEEGTTVKYSRKIVNDGTVEKIPLTEKTMYIDYGREGCTLAVRKSFFDEIKNYWFTAWAHDEFLWTMALVKNGCYVFNRVTMQRRFHTNNVSKRKIHNKEKRLQLLKSLERGHTTMKEYAEYLNPKDVVATEKIQESIECIQNRIKVIEKKSFSAMIKNLFLYRRYYPNFKSIFMDYYIAVRKE